MPSMATPNPLNVHRCDVGATLASTYGQPQALRCSVRKKSSPSSRLSDSTVSYDRRLSPAISMPTTMAGTIQIASAAW